MGIRQEHGKVLKLQVAQSLFGLIPHNEREAHEASFESAYRNILGENAWDSAGLSMESAEGLGYYLRGVASASGKPIKHNQAKVMRTLAREVLSLESRASGYDDGTLAGAIARTTLEGEAQALLKRYGLEQLSTEGFAVNAIKSIGTIIGNLFKGKEKKPGTQKIETQFDASNVDYSQVHKMADYIDEIFLNDKASEDWTQVVGKISGEGIVKNLTWGHEFDQGNPLAFQKKKFAEWDKFYHAHEAAVARMSSAIMADEKSTRAAINAAKDDEDKMEKILSAAVSALVKIENPSDVAAKMKPDFPGARTTSIYKRGEFDYDSCNSAPDKAFKDISEIRPLKVDEAKALLTWLRDQIRGMKKYTTVFDKAKWSDHSDGDAIWEQAENVGQIDTYAGLIYWQSCEQDFMEMDDISEILAHLSNGIVNWVTRSFK